MMKKYCCYRGLSLVLVILGLALLLAIPAGTAQAEDAIKVSNQTWDAHFRDYLTFTLQAESTAQIVQANLYYQIVGQVATSRNDADFTPGKSIEAKFTLDQTKPENYLPPGTELHYWWKIVDASGNELKTEKGTLLYLDDRYSWQKLDNKRLTLYWYDGGNSFGQALFDRANQALDTLETDIGITIDNPIKIFIYANHNDLLGAISTAAQDWTGGQAFTDYGVVVIGVQSNQLDWGLNATTHEMTHLVIHQATNNSFTDLPHWLDEGIAVYNERQDKLVDDFRPVFEQAVKNNELMSLRTLSSPFPSDPYQANLAYGESGAVVKFIVDTYGPEAMGKLLHIFSEGALYDEALQQALGVNMDGLDNAFRASLGLPPLPGTEGSQISAQPAAVSQEDKMIAVTEAAVSQEAAVNNPAPSSPPVEAPVPAADQSQSQSSSLPCLAGILPLLGVGLVLTSRRAMGFWLSCS
jgi:hypothetical protein